MLVFVGLMATICTSCAEPHEPLGPRLGVPLPTVDQQISDGCARFQVRFDAGGSPIIEPIYGVGFSSYCEMNELKLLSDTAGTFDPVTGALRLAVVMENMGSAAVIPRVKLRFNADSVIRLDAQGNVVVGTPDILGYQPDSASTNGRNAYWFFDQSLAPSGQPQMLMPGARTQRRWLEFRGTGWTDRVRLKLFATGAEQSQLVPAVPADTAPAWIFADSNLVTNDPQVSGSFLKRVLAIEFLPQATQTQKESAVAAVSGTVIGGVRWSSTEGYYYVLLPPDSTTASLHQAVAILGTLPQVVVAELVIVRITQPDFLKPQDGQSWRQWNLRPDYSVLTARSALERAMAPLAWGCSIGADDTPIAVVDADARNNGDLIYNGALSLGVGSSPFAAAPEHGTAVASIVAARGNNNSGMVGVAWKSDLRFYEYAPASPVTTVTTVLARIRRAVRDGARVVNFSSSISGSWGSRTPGTAADSQLVNRVRRLTSAMIARLKAEGFDPLLVLPAGDFFGPTERSAYWGGYSASKHDHPMNVLVVASASSAPGVLTPTSGRGSLVTVAAIGESVYALDAANPEGRPRSGVSFSAPQATGVIGLLLAFDPRLSAAELIQLVESGATVGGELAGSIPYLNAYSSLIEAAKRSGAPLCGNRLWAVGTDVFAQRTSGPEKIATLPSTWTHPNRLLPLHGGRLFWAASGGDIAAYEWTPSGFATSTRLPEAWEPFRGTTVSLQATHDGDSTAIAGISGASTLQVEATGLSGNFPAGPTIPVGSPIAVTGPVSQTERRCARFDFTQNQTYECADSLTISLLDEHSTVRVLPSPGFGRIAVAVTRWQSRLIDEISQVCLNQTYANPPKCPKFVFEEEPLSTRMMVLRRSDGAVLADWTVSGVSVHPNTFSEDDTELAVEQRHVLRQTAVVEIPVTGGLGWQLQVQLMGETTSQCALAFYNQPAGQATPAATIPLSSNRCVESIATSAFGRVANPLATLSRD